MNQRKPDNPDEIIQALVVGVFFLAVAIFAILAYHNGWGTGKDCYGSYDTYSGTCYAVSRDYSD